MALIFCWVSASLAVAVPVAAGWQRGAAGQDDPARAVVGEPAGRQQTERTQTTGDQVRRIRAASQRLVHRLAGHRREGRCQELAVAQRENRLRGLPENRGQRRHQTSDVCAVRQVDQAAPQLRLLGPDDPGGSPHRALGDRGVRTALANTASDDPQRDRVAFVALGQLSDQVDQLHRHAHRAVDIGFTGTGFGDIEHVAGIGDSGRRVAGVSQAVAKRTGNVVLAQHRNGARAGSQMVVVALDGRERLPVEGVHHRRGIVVAAGGRARIHCRVAKSAHFDTRAAIRCDHRDVDDELFVVAATPANLDAATRVGELGVEPDARDRGRHHQPRILAVQQPADVNSGVQQRN